MNDFDLHTQNDNFSQNQGSNSTRNLKDQVVDAGAEVKQRAGDALRASTDVARDKFREAIRTKLVLEVAGRTPERRVVPVAASEPRVNCMIGEKIWQDRWGR